MKIDNIKIGDKVVYIPKHLLVGPRTEMVKIEHLGIVTSKNDHFVFVKYNSGVSQATASEDLYTLRYRQDLIDQITVDL